jgi:hypothetical protein
MFVLQACIAEQNVIMYLRAASFNNNIALNTENNIDISRE